MTQAQFGGRWYLEKTEDWEEYIKALQLTPERKVEILPLMLPTGEDGRVEVFNVDDDYNCFSRRSYCNGKLFREFLYPFDVQVPGWSLNGKLCKITWTRPKENRIESHEIGQGYELRAFMEVQGDVKYAEMATTAGPTVKLVYRRCKN